MKRRVKDGWSLLVLRGADRSVKQFHVTRRSAIAGPAAVLLAVGGCLALLQLRAVSLTRALEDQLAAQATVHTHVVERKEHAIVSLRHEMSRLEERSAALQQELKELHALEEKLQRFIAVYDDISIPAAHARIPLPDEHKLLQLRAAEALSFAELGELVDAMETAMAHTVRLAKAEAAEARAVPSAWPTLSFTLTSSFGYRKDPFTGRAAFHAGIDIAGKVGDPVFAAADGEVSEAGFDKSKGYYVRIEHENQLSTQYYHLKSVEAQAGDYVVQGEKIGLLGSTGRSTGPHLHFEIMQRETPVNPLRYLNLVKEE